MECYLKQYIFKNWKQQIFMQTESNPLFAQDKKISTSEKMRTYTDTRLSRFWIIST